MLPTASVPKLTLAAEKVTGALALPETLTLCVPALSVIVRTPEAGPTTIGEKMTAMVHDAAGAMLPMQLFVWVNVPVSATLVTCRGPVPELCTVTLFTLLEVPTICEENEIDAGVTVAAGAVPVPFSTSVCKGPKL